MATGFQKAMKKHASSLDRMRLEHQLEALQERN